ncbi:MAG: 50S ribosomal protein L23 [Deltaproteobacteria bacterium]|nr:50S ribosomal protein L23 [Deltaproteobacteria bacterium]
MKDIYSVIKSPVITEKSTAAVADGNKVVFWVELAANKKEVKEAIEKAFNVKVIGVNTQRVPGKLKKMGKYAGITSTRKKAYVTLKEGDKIELFAGV